MMHLALATLALVLSALPAFAQTPAEKGREVYTAQKCSICHSIGATGNKKGPLDDVGSRLSAAEIRMWITDAPAMAVKTKAERKPAMKAYPSLAKEDLDALVAYMSSLKK